MARRRRADAANRSISLRILLLVLCLAITGATIYFWWIAPPNYTSAGGAITFVALDLGLIVGIVQLARRRRRSAT
jgi:hypothetical protein